MLITILVIALVAVVAFWILQQIPIPYPIDLVVKVIVGIILIVALLRVAGLDGGILY